MIFASDDIFSRKMMELLISKMTHDLAGPIGATENGLELLEDDITYTEALAIAKQSASNVAGRLRYYRLAFGSSSACSNIDAKSIYNTTVAFFGDDDKVKISVAELKDAISAEMTKLLFNIILCAKDALMYGGTINIENNASNLIINVKSKDSIRPLKQSTLITVTEDTIFPDDLSVYNIQYWFTGYYGFNSGITINQQFTTPDHLIITLTNNK